MTINKLITHDNINIGWVLEKKLGLTTKAKNVDMTKLLKFIA